VLARALARSPEQRHQTARELAIALEKVCPPASAATVSDWVMKTGAERLTQKAAQLAAVESAPLPEITAAAGPSISGRRAVRTASMPIIPFESSAISPAADTPVPIPAPPLWSALAGHGWRWWATALGALAALLTVVVMLVSPGQQRPVTTVLPPPPVEATRQLTPATSAPPPVTDPEAATPASAGLKPHPIPSTIAEPPPEPAPTAARNPAERRRPARARAVGATAPVNAACEPPYVVDPRGIRRIKPECLELRSAP
jgi:eukaryotic-like serine/threonine-protein kinase